ncbi:uncharacterized protein LOC144123952 [Amblyomma americanum]
MWRLLLLSGASYSTGAVWSGITVCTFGIHPMWRLLLLSGASYSTGAVWSGITVCTFAAKQWCDLQGWFRPHDSYKNWHSSHVETAAPKWSTILNWSSVEWYHCLHLWHSSHVETAAPKWSTILNWSSVEWYHCLHLWDCCCDFEVVL